MSPFDTELAVITSLSGFRETTVLKFPLVPRTQPRAWKSRPISLKARAAPGTFGLVGMGTVETGSLIPRTLTALEVNTRPADKPNGSDSNGWGGKLLTLLKMLSKTAGPLALAALCLMLVPASAGAQIYSWRDANGNLVLANTPRPGAAQAAAPRPVAAQATAPRPVAAQGPVESVRSYPVPKSDTIRTKSRTVSDRVLMYDGLITQHAQLNDVRPDLVRAVVEVESAYNPYARSPKGAAGLMQLMPATAQQFGVKNSFNPEENIRAGVAYLRQLLTRYANNEELALAAYNAGPGAVDKYGETVPPYRETKDYVLRINGISAPRPVERRAANRIYKITETVDGRQVVRYTDKRPTTGSFAAVP
jgi:soluble lytic murein transglycosylase-like protein